VTYNEYRILFYLGFLYSAQKKYLLQQDEGYVHDIGNKECNDFGNLFGIYYEFVVHEKSEQNNQVASVQIMELHFSKVVHHFPLYRNINISV
jgi:hypothetical protein